MIAGYARVSTADQHLDRQLESISDYTTRTFDSTLDDRRVFDGKSTGTNVGCAGYQKLMEHVDDGAVSAVFDPRYRRYLACHEPPV